MSEYIFYDTDITGEADYDISDENYVKLITLCCKYSTYLSLRITSKNIPCIKELEKYNIPKNDKLIYMYDHFYKENSIQSEIEVKYYFVCPELCNLLLNITNSIFKWRNGCGHVNPEDPVFYRSDGSVFFSSIIHDGRCMLYPNNEEDIREILINENWIEIKE